jgi:Fic family protein
MTMNIDGIISRISREIREKQELIENDLDYDIQISNGHNTALAYQANVFSWFIEHPQLQREILNRARNKNHARKILSKLSKSAKKVSKKGWEYLREQRPLKENINNEVLQNLGEIIEPTYGWGYRNVRVSLGYGNFTPPNPIRVPDHINETFEQFQDISNPIEAAFFLHLRLAGIQPFRDGNKRTARMLQNRLLYEERLPAAVIKPAEASFYFNLLGKALEGYQEENKKDVYPFFNFLATKINDQLDSKIEKRNTVISGIYRLERKIK